MDKIDWKKTESNALREYFATSPDVHKLLDWIGENKITYDGYKFWVRTWDINTYSNKKQEIYNTKQLIEQFLKEIT